MKVKIQKRENSNQSANSKEKKYESVMLSFAQLEGHCYCCGKVGHKQPNCYQKDKTPRKDWAINKAQSHAQEKSAEQSWLSNLRNSSNLTESTKNTKKNNSHVGWAGVHCQFTQVPDMPDLILLDSGSTDAVLCNHKYVQDIKASEKPLTLGTNGGPMVMKQR